LLETAVEPGLGISWGSWRSSVVTITSSGETTFRPIPIFAGTTPHRLKIVANGGFRSTFHFWQVFM